MQVSLGPVLLLLLCSVMPGSATNFFSLSATTLSGKVVQFSQYRGKVSLKHKGDLVAFKVK